MTITKDLLAGLIFTLVGVAVVIIAQDYPMGTLGQMGPAYFPTIIGSLTILVGLGLILNSLLIKKADPLPKFALRQFIFLIGAIIIFALTLEKFGLVLSTVLLIIFSRLAARPVNWVGASVLSVCLVSIAVLIFWYLLQMPLNLWP